MDRVYIPSEYEKVNFLGRGSYGTVFLYQKVNGSEQIALKYSDLTEENKHKARGEMHFTIDFHGPMFEPFFAQLMAQPRVETVKNKDSLYLPFEYCAGGDLFKYIQQVTEAQIQRIIFYVATGLKHMHRRKVAHRDIKAENILASSNDLDTADFKICDLGMARMLELKIKSPDIVTQPQYQRHSSEDGLTCLQPIESVAPEMENGHYDCRVDIWSLGVLAKDLAYGRSLIVDNPQREMAAEYQNNPEHFSLKDDKFSPSLNAFISATTSEARVRPDIEEVLRLPLLKQWREQQVHSLLYDGAEPRINRLILKTKRNGVMKINQLNEANAFIRETIEELQGYRKKVIVYAGPDLVLFSEKIDELLGANRFLLAY